jgi:hypothetical protein
MPAEPGQQWPGSQFPEGNDISKLPAVLGGGDQSHACHTAHPSVNVNLPAHDGDAVNTIIAPDWSSAFNTSPLIGLLCQPVQTAALIPILIRHLK